MHSFTTISFILAASIFSLVSALPTADPSMALTRRSCQISYPTFMTQLTEHSESPTDSDFCISSGSRVQFAQFNNIPATPIGACQLEFVFPAGYSVAGAGSHQVNIWKVDRPISKTDTWNNAPKQTYLFGTVTLNSRPSEDVKLVVNSGDCASMKDFKFTIADNGNGVGGTVNYQQQDPSAAIFAGMRIVHSC